jgi:fibronectin-binding autotransporter adhesin
MTPVIKQTQPKVTDQHVTIGGASKYLGVSIDTIRRWERAGKLQAHRLDGKNRHFYINDLETFLQIKPLSTADVATQLNVSQSTVRRLEDQGLLTPHRSEHGKRLYDPMSVGEYLTRKEQGSLIVQPTPIADLALASVTTKAANTPVESHTEAHSIPVVAIEEVKTQAVADGDDEDDADIYEAAMAIQAPQAVRPTRAPKPPRQPRLQPALAAAASRVSAAVHTTQRRATVSDIWSDFLAARNPEDKRHLGLAALGGMLVLIIIMLIVSPWHSSANQALAANESAAASSLAPISLADKLENASLKTNKEQGLSLSSTFYVQLPGAGLTVSVDNTQGLRGAAVASDNFATLPVGGKQLAQGGISFSNLSPELQARINSGGTGNNTTSGGTTYPTYTTVNQTTVQAGLGLSGSTSNNVLTLGISSSGCSAGQVLQYTGSQWACATVSSGGGNLAIQSGGSTVTPNASAVNFATNDFTVSNNSGQANIGINYAGSGIITSSNTNTITSVGTITSGVWQGSTLGVQFGGTGANTFTSNGLIYGNGTGALQASAAGTSGQILQADASGVPSFTTLSGDATISATGALALANTTVVANTYGDATHVPMFVVDAKGRITSVTDTLITGAAPTGAAGGDLTGNFPNPTIGAGKVTNVDLVNSSSTVNNGSNITGGGVLALGGSLTLSVSNTPTFSGLVSGNGGLTVSGTTTLSSLSAGVVHAGSGGVLTSSLVVLGTDTSGSYIASVGSTNSSIVTGGTASNPTFSVSYGTGANQAAAGNNTITCATATGNLSTTGTSFSTGASGNCGSISITNAPSFTTSVTSPSFTSTGVLGLSSGGASDLSLTSASNKIVIGATTLQSAGSLNTDLSGAGAYTYTVKNSGTGTADLNINNGALQVGATSVITSARVLQNVTADAGIITTGTVSNSRLAASVTVQGNSFNGASQLVQLTAAGKLPAIDGSLLTGIVATSYSGTLGVANGGTGATSLTANGIVYGNGTGTVGVTAAGTAGQILLSNAGVPTFTSLGGDVATVTSGGLVTIGTGAVTGTKIANTTITNANLASGSFGAITSVGTLTSLALSGVITGATTVDGATLSGGSLSATAVNGVTTANITTQGNAFNGASQLLQLNASTQIPAVSGALVTNLNASALASGTVPSAVVSGAYTNITGLGTLTGLTVASGTVSLPANSIANSALQSTVTLAGNTFNGNSQLVQTTAGGLLPVLNGSNLTNVTATTFTGTITNANLTAGSYGNITGVGTLGTLAVTGAVTGGTYNGATLSSTAINGVTTATITTQGNTFNGASQLLQLNASTQIPAVSGTLVTNLNASALASGTVPAGVVSGSYTGITAVGTLTSLAVTGAVTGGTYNGATISGGTLTATGISGAAAFSIASTGANDLTLTSGSNNIALGTVATFTTSNTNESFDLKGAAANTFIIKNSGTGTADLNINNGGLQIGGSTVLSSAKVLSGLTGFTVASGTVSLPANSISNAALQSTVTLAGNTFNGNSQLVQLTAASLLPALNGSNLTNLSAGNIAGTVSGSNGGTGISSYAIGDLLYGATTSTLGKLADVAAGSCLVSGGLNVAPGWGSCAAGGGITGSGTAGSIPVFTASGVVGNSTLSQSGAVLSLATGNSLTVVGGNVTVTGSGSFSTSVTTPSLTNTAALAVSSGGASDLTLTSASNKLVLAATTIQTGASENLDLNSASATTLTVKNTGTSGVADLNINNGGLQIGGSTVLSSTKVLSGLTGLTVASGSVSLPANSIANAALQSTVTLAGNTFNGNSQLVQTTAGGLLPVLNGSNLTNVTATTFTGTITNANLTAGSYANIQQVGTLGTLTVTGAVTGGTYNGATLSSTAINGVTTANITTAGNTFNGNSQLVQTTAGGLLPVLNGSNLTNVTATTFTGTITNANLTAGSYGNITAVGTLTSLAITGAVTGGTYNGATISGGTLTATGVSGAAAFSIASTGANDLTLTSGSNNIALGATSLTTANTSESIDLKGAAANVFTVKNSGTGTADFNINNGGLQIGGTTVLSSAKVLSGLTGLTVASGTVSLPANSIANAALQTSVTTQGNTFNGNSQLVQTTAGGLLPVLNGSNLTNVAASTATTAGSITGSGVITNANLNSATSYTNITSVGSLTGLTVASGSVSLPANSIANAALQSTVTLAGNTFNGNSQLVQTTAGGLLPVLNGSNLTNITASSFTGTITNANLTAGSYGNITGVGTLGTLAVTGAVTGGTYNGATISSTGISGAAAFSIASTGANDLTLTSGSNNIALGTVATFTTSNTSEAFDLKGAGANSFTVKNSGTGTADLILNNGSLFIGATNVLSSTKVLSGLTGLTVASGSVSLPANSIANAALQSTVTLSGNTFNGNSQLVQTTAGGLLPVLNGSNLTSLTSGNLSGALPAISGAALTALSSSALSGALPALNGSALTNVAASSLTGTISNSNIPASSNFTNITGVGTLGSLAVTGAFTQTYSTAVASSAHVINVTNINAAAGVAVQGVDLTPSNANASSSTNVLNLVNFNAGAALGANAQTNGFNFASATGYSNFLKTPTAVLSSAGALTGLTGLTVASGSVSLPANSIANAALQSTVTLAGNTFNGNSQLVQTTAGGLLPVLNGSNLTNVTATTFTGTITNANLTAGSYANIQQVGTLGTLTVTGAVTGGTYNGATISGGTLTATSVSGAAAFGISSTGANDLSVTSGSGNIALGATSLTTANTSESFDLKGAAANTFIIKNSGTGTADLNINNGGLQIGGTSIISSAKAISGLTGLTVASGTISFPAGSLNSSALTGALPALSGASLTSLNATQLTTGTVPTAAISGAYGNVTAVGTLTSLALSGAITGATSVDGATLSSTAVNGLTFSGAGITGGGAGTFAIASGGAARDLTIDASTTGAVTIGGTSTGNIVFGAGSGGNGCTVTRSNGDFACGGKINGITHTATAITAAAGLTIASTGANDLILTSGSNNIALGTVATFTTSNTSESFDLKGAGANSFTVKNTGTGTADLVLNNGSLFIGVTNVLTSAKILQNVSIAASQLTGAISAASLTASNVTTQGNTFNGNTQLVQTTAAGLLPVLNGSNLTNVTASSYSGTLSVANGGTGQVSLTTNGIIYGNAAGAVGVTAAGTAGQILLSNAGVPTFISLGGDVASVSSTGLVALANTTVTATSYGDATHVATFTVDGKGRITTAGTALITGGNPVGPAGGSLTGNYPNPTIASNVITDTNLTAGSFTNITGVGTLASLAVTGAITGGTYNGLTIGSTAITAAGSLTEDLNSAAANTLTITNGGTGTADVNIAKGGLQIAGTTILSSAKALSGLTGISLASGAINVNGGGLTSTGSIAGATTIAANNTITDTATGATPAIIASGAPSALATSGLIQIGSALTSGSANGTFLSVNQGGSADFLNFQVSNASKLAVTSGGAVTATGQVTAVGVNGGTGSIQGTGGLTITGASTITGTLGGVTNLTLSGTISGGTSITGSGNINSTGGGLQTASVTRIDNTGNLTGIGNFTSTGASIFSTTGAGNGFTFRPGVDNATAFQIQSAAGAATILSVNSSTLAVTIAGTTTTFGSLTLTNAHFKSTQTTAPIGATPTTCGTAPPAATVAVNSTDTAGSVTVTEGAVGPAACVTVFTFNKAYAAAPKAIIITPSNLNAFTTKAFVSASSTTTFTLTFGAATAANAVQTFTYFVVE